MREDRDPYMRVGVDAVDAAARLPDPQPVTGYVNGPAVATEPDQKPDAEQVRSIAARARDEFWRVVTDAFPRPDGDLSLDCINRFRDASDAAVREWVERNWPAAPADLLPPGVRHDETVGFAETWDAYDALTAADGWKLERGTRRKEKVFHGRNVTVYAPLHRESPDAA